MILITFTVIEDFMMTHPAEAIRLACKAAKEHQHDVRLQLDDERLVICYAAGGISQQRVVPGTGWPCLDWALADNEDWPEVNDAVLS